MYERKELYLFYYRDANVFMDFNGQIIYDIFRIMSPNDLYMFRSNPTNNTFWHRSDDDILCRIITVRDDDKSWGWYLCEIEDIIRYDLAHQCYLEGDY